MDIKKIFDEDNIYDLLMAGNIDSRILSLLNTNHFIKPHAINLIQRSCFDGYSWANEWTTKVYEFLKPLTKTHLLTNTEVNGSDYGFTPEYTADIPSSLDIATIPDTVTLKVYPKSTVTITWLQSSHKGVSFTYCNKINNNISCYEKRAKVVSADDKAIEIELDSKYWLWNSVVIEGNGILIGITNEQKEVMLYEFLQQTLSNIYNQFNLTTCRLLTGITATVNTTIATFEGVRRYPYAAATSAFDPSVSCPVILDESIVYSQPLFQVVPDSYYFVYKEDNNGSSGNKPIVYYNQTSNTFSLSFNLEGVGFFEKWRNSLVEKNPSGYDINNGGSLVIPNNPPEYNAPSILEVSHPIPLNTETIIFRTVANNQSLGSNWFTTFYSSDYSYTFTSYPCLDRNNVAFKTSIGNTPLPSLLVPSNSAKNGYKFGFYIKTTNPLNNIYNFQYGVNSSYKIAPFSAINNQIENYSFMKFRYNFVVVPFIGEDYTLFSSSEVGVVKNSIDIKIDWSIERYQNDGGTALRQLDTTLNEITCNQAIKINVDFTDVESAYITNSVITNQADITYQSQNYGDVSSEVYVDPQSWNFFNNQAVSQSISLRRSLRTSRINNINIIYIENSLHTVDDSAMQTIVDSAIMANEFDPNTDNGDIMPDSQRLIEIHAALQADKFAYDDTGNTLRKANLGYYIERLARILGISVNSDGSLRQVRQRMTFDPNTKQLPSGWTRGQWSVNNGNDSYGQAGGLSSETRDGIAYKHRCNRSIESAFNSEEFELGSPLMTLCENYFQFFETFLEDLDAGLNWQEMGAMAIPSPFPDDEGNNTYCTFEGMGTLLAEIAYSQGVMSKDTSQTFISSIVIQDLIKATLASLGTPVEPAYRETSVDTDEGEFSSKIPTVVLSSDSPTIVQLLFNVIANQAKQAGSQAKLKVK